jgi:DNA-binding beta-propeller fold protein YncE
MLWSDWGSPAKIEIANMDGTGRRDLVTGNGLIWPNGLAVDGHTNKLYWTDAKSDTIECIDLSGRNRAVLLRNLQHPFGLDVFEGHLYWTDWITKDIKRAPLMTLSNITVMKSNLPGLMDIKVYSASRQQGQLACLLNILKVSKTQLN